MVTAARFSPSLLNDLSALKGWIQDPSHLLPVKNTGATKNTSMLARRWQMGLLEVVSFFHDKVIRVVLNILQKGLVASGALRLAKRVELINLHISSAKKHLLAAKTHKTALLSFSRNHPHLYASDLYLQPPIAFSTLQNPEVRALVDSSSVSQRLDFFHEKGVCRGMCFWFIYLYFATMNHFEDPRAHIASVAKQFENGAPAPAILLHSFLRVEYPLLALDGEARSVSFSSFEAEKDTFAKYPPGVYSLGIGKHRINYIKISGTEAFFFDPNVGTWHVKGNDQAEKSHRYICATATQFGIIPYAGGELKLSYCTGIVSSHP